MALPSSGQLSMSDIANEQGISLSNVSLRSMSSTAGFSTPDAVSEFYGYSHVTLNSFTSSLMEHSTFLVCIKSINQTYYVDYGAHSYFPVVGQVCYTSSSGTSYLPGGYYRTHIGLYISINAVGGVINSKGFCGGCMLEGTEVMLSNGNITTIENLIVGDSLASLVIETIPDTSVDCTDCVDDLLTWKTSTLENTSGNAEVILNDPLEVAEIVNINDGLLKSSTQHVHIIKRDGEWQGKRAFEIKVGDILLNNQNEEIPVTTTEMLEDGPYTVYILNVETNDVFYANGILTHNAK